MSNHAKIENPRTSSSPSPTEPSRVGHSTIKGNQEGGLHRGPPTELPTTSHARGEVGNRSKEVRDHLRGGPREGVPNPTRDLDPSVSLLAAFFEGDFDKTLQIAKDLQEAYHASLMEASRLRFKLNFATEVCETCEGLRAGPNVAATCYQVKRCDYKNIRVGDELPRHQSIIGGLVGEKD